MLLALVEAVSTNLTTVAVAVVTALGGLLGGTFLLAGPQRRNITQEATDRAIKSIDGVRASLEARLIIVEGELSKARDSLHAAQLQIQKLEGDLALSKSERGELVAGLLAERLRLQSRVRDLEHRVRDFQRRLPPTAKDELREDFDATEWEHPGREDIDGA